MASLYWIRPWTQWNVNVPAFNGGRPSTGIMLHVKLCCLQKLQAKTSNFGWSIVHPIHSLYHDCWCPGSLRRQVIISHGIDCVNTSQMVDETARNFVTLQIWTHWRIYSPMEWTIISSGNDLSSKKLQVELSKRKNIRRISIIKY